MKNEKKALIKKLSKQLWQGRNDSNAPTRLHEAIIFNDIDKISKWPFANKHVGFLGFSSDEGVRRNLGNIGAVEGPDALRRALANLPIPQQAMIFSDFGTVCCQNDALEEAQSELAEIVKKMIGKDILPILLGGGHEIAWANYQGISAACPDKKITVINFDAHLDLRPLLLDDKGSSGTSFTQISKFCAEHSKPFDYICLGIQEMSNTSLLFETAENLKVKILLADEFHLGGIEPALEFLDEVLLHSEVIHLTICLDVFASAFAPGVSAPQSLGLMPWQVIPLLHRLASSGKVISLDIAELCPPRDIDGRTAHLAAALIYQFLNHYHCPKT